MRATTFVSCAVFAVTVWGASLTSGCSAVKPASEIACPYNVTVGPATATADHAALAPGNQAQFVEGGGVECNALLARLSPAWSNPDPINIQISSANDATNGTAICKGPTNGAVTLTSTITVQNVLYTKTVALTCQ